MIVDRLLRGQRDTYDRILLKRRYFTPYQRSVYRTLLEIPLGSTIEVVGDDAEAIRIAEMLAEFVGTTPQSRPVLREPATTDPDPYRTCSGSSSARAPRPRRAATASSSSRRTSTT